MGEMIRLTTATEIIEGQHRVSPLELVLKSQRVIQTFALQREMSNSSILPRGTACNACRVRKVVRATISAFWYIANYLRRRNATHRSQHVPLAFKQAEPASTRPC